MKPYLYLCGLLPFFCLSTVQAQVETSFVTGGGVRIGWSMTSCNAAIAGAIRYNSASGGAIDYCNGASWQNVGSSGGASAINDLSDAHTDYTTRYNLFMGQNAGQGVVAGAVQNLAIGQNALDAALTSDADYNMAIGYNALGALTASVANVAIGVEAMALHTNGSSNEWAGNVAIGYRAMRENNGEQNVAIGERAMEFVTGNGVRNVAIGAGALGDATASSHNVAVGAGALGHITDYGEGNVAIGTVAGDSITRGGANVILGENAGRNITEGSNNIIIGADVDAPSSTDDNQLNIGNLIYGNMSASKYVGINTSSPAHTLHVTGDIAYTGVITDLSDARHKRDVQDLSSALQKITALRPVSFTMKDDPQRQVEYGFIAQDVQALYPDLVTIAADDNQTLSMNYIGLIAPLVKAVQEQQAIIERQQAQIDSLLRQRP